LVLFEQWVGNPGYIALVVVLLLIVWVIDVSAMDNAEE